LSGLSGLSGFSRLSGFVGAGPVIRETKETTLLMYLSTNSMVMMGAAVT
jgi:hypothetical protein